MVTGPMRTGANWPIPNRTAPIVLEPTTQDMAYAGPHRHGSHHPGSHRLDRTLLHRTVRRQLRCRHRHRHRRHTRRRRCGLAEWDQTRLRIRSPWIRPWGGGWAGSETRSVGAGLISRRIWTGLRDCRQIPPCGIPPCRIWLGCSWIRALRGRFVSS